jgi:hypothetical protein
MNFLSVKWGSKRFFIVLSNSVLRWVLLYSVFLLYYPLIDRIDARNFTAWLDTAEPRSAIEITISNSEVSLCGCSGLSSFYLNFLSFPVFHKRYVMLCTKWLCCGSETRVKRNDKRRVVNDTHVLFWHYWRRYKTKNLEQAAVALEDKQRIIN